MYGILKFAVPKYFHIESIGIQRGDFSKVGESEKFVNVMFVVTRFDFAAWKLRGKQGRVHRPAGEHLRHKGILAWDKGN